MSASVVAEPILQPGPAAPTRSRRALDLSSDVLRWVIVAVSSLVVFGAFVSARHVDPLAMYQGMLEGLFTNYGLGQVLDRAAPIVLAAMAVALPARAGIINIGGEGQLVIGATAAAGAALGLGAHLSGPPALILMALAGAAAGGLWAGIAALLKIYGNVNEAISTLLLNYVGADVLAYLVFGPWKDAAGNGQPASRPLLPADTLPLLPGMQAHNGIVLALLVVGVTAAVLAWTRWGFSLRAVGGNLEAARRAGLPVVVLVISALLAGGALAGLAGMIQFAGLEGQLRPGLGATFGYTGFLASWLARHQPGRLVLAALLLSCIAVAGNSLQITSHLPGSAVNVLMALVLLAVLAQKPRRAVA
jgi:simple sugar transport system permease protein